MNKINKYIFIFMFSIISMLVFILRFEAYNPLFIENFGNVEFFNFVREFRYSLKEFDVIYVITWFLILYFYSKVYFDGKKDKKRMLFCVITSIILTIVTIIGKSYLLNNSLEFLFSSVMQIIKTIIFTLGYYLIYYALLKKLLYLKFNFKSLKKKDRLF